MVALLVAWLVVKMDDLMVYREVVLKVAFVAGRMDENAVGKLDYLSGLETAAW